MERQPLPEPQEVQDSGRVATPDVTMPDAAQPTLPRAARRKKRKRHHA
jgi:hypothetical protein